MHSFPLSLNKQTKRIGLNQSLGLLDIREEKLKKKDAHAI